jgi:hypothetical protein
MTRERALNKIVCFEYIMRKYGINKQTAKNVSYFIERKFVAIFGRPNYDKTA